MQAKFWCLTVYTRIATRKPLLILIYVHIIRVIGLFNCTSSRILGNEDRICNDKDPKDGVSDSNMLCGEFSVNWETYIYKQKTSHHKKGISSISIAYHCPPWFLVAETISYHIIVLPISFLQRPLCWVPQERRRSGKDSGSGLKVHNFFKKNRYIPFFF